MNRHRSLRIAAAVALLSLAATGCRKSSTSRPAGLGKALVRSASRSLQATADGQTLVFVADVAPPQEKEAPEGTLQGTLTLAAVGGGRTAQLGGGVTTLPDAYRIAPDGRSVAFLQGFRFREQAGALQLATLPQGEVSPLASGATFYRYSPDSRWLGYVAGGALHLVELASKKDRTLARDVSTFEFSPDSNRLLARKPISAGGTLVLAQVETEAAPRELDGFVGEYGFSADGRTLAYTARSGGLGKPYLLFLRGEAGEGEPRRIGGEGVTGFAFSPDSKWIAFVEGQGVNKTFGDLAFAPVAAGEPKRIGENAQEYVWAADSRSLAVRESHEDKAGRSWQAFKVVTVPTGAVRLKETNVHNFLLAPSGAHVAFLKKVTKPVFSVDLFVMPIEGEAPAREIAKGVYTYQFSSDEKELWYRARCVRNGRACELYVQPVDAPASSAAPEAKGAQGAPGGPGTAAGVGAANGAAGDAGAGGAVAAPTPAAPAPGARETPPAETPSATTAAASRPLAEGILSFKTSARGGKVLLTWPRLDTEHAADLGYLQLPAREAPKGIDVHTLPGALFLDPEGKRVAYLVSERKREGVYVAELP